MLRALIFDVDGTLADTEEIHRQAFNAAFRKMSLDWVWGRNEYKKLLEISGGKERIAHYIDTLQTSPADRAADADADALRACIPLIHGTKTRIYKDMIESGQLAPRPGVVRLLTQARAAGLKLAIATTTTMDNVHALLHHAFPARGATWFDSVGAGDLVENKKPAPDIYNLVLSTLRVPRHECVAFEDSVNGLRAAKAAGLCTIVTPTQWTRDHDFTGADLLIPCLGDDAGSAPYAGLGLAEIERLLQKNQSMRVRSIAVGEGCA